MKQTIRLKFPKMLYAVCLALMPLVMMFFQYQQNIEDLFFGHILMFSAITASVLLALFFMSRLILKTNINAFFFSGFVFICFFFLWNPYLQIINRIDRFIHSIGFSPVLILTFALACGLLIIATIIVLGFVKAKKSPTFAEKLIAIFSDSKKVIIVASATIIALVFIFTYMQFFGNYGIITKALVSYVGLATFIFAIAYIFFLNRIKDDSNARYTAPFIAIFLCIILIMNAIPIIAFASAQETDDNFFKQHFNVTKPLDRQPNIYWFFLDGMLGFDAMSRFFGEDQGQFASELESRGFFINRDAGLRIIHGTTDAIPILFNPFFYDRVISWSVHSAYAESLPKNKDLLLNSSLRISPNQTSLRTARERNETILAFNAAGFNTSTIANIDHFFFPNVSQFYCMGDLSAPLLTATRSIEENMDLFQTITYEQNFLTLISRMTPLSILLGSIRLREDIRPARRLANAAVQNAFERVKVDMELDFLANMNLCNNGRAHFEESNVRANILLDIFKLPEPRFVTIMCRYHHHSFGWVFDELGNFNNENVRFNLSRYAPHHLFINNIILRYVDLILENDPNAVIVLQSDHGLVHSFNHLGIEEIMEHFNCSEEEALALRYSPMSAIRVPDMVVGGGVLTSETMQVLSDPRNISRFLINNFVGENYEYIPYEYRQVFRGPLRNH